MTCSAPHLSLPYLHVSYNQYAYLAPPGGAPTGRITSPETYPCTSGRSLSSLTAMLNVLDYTQVKSQNLAGGQQLLCGFVPLCLPPAPLKNPNTGRPPFIPLSSEILRAVASDLHLPAFPAHHAALPAIDGSQGEHAREGQGVQRIEQPPGRPVAAAGAQEHRSR